MRWPPATWGWIVLISLAGCRKPSPPSAQKSPPARITKHPSEDNISLLTLTPKAVERLGIKTGKIARLPLTRYRTLGGDVVVPAGKTIIVTAPLNGTLRLPGQGTLPLPGKELSAGQPLFTFVPLLPPERAVPNAAERVQIANARASLLAARKLAEGDVQQAQAEVKAAQLRLAIARRLYAEMTGTERAVKEAEAQLNVAQKKFEAARARQKALEKFKLESAPGQVPTLEITSPEYGLLRNLSARPGQTVSAGAPLFEVVNINTVWIRVPIYVGQLKDFDLNADAQIGPLPGGGYSSTRTAKRQKEAPPTADAASNSVHVYYEISNTNPSDKLYPGQRVGVTIPLKTDEEALVAPWGAILHDIHGFTWVYEKIADNTFRRRRVFVKYSQGKWAVLDSRRFGNQQLGPPVGAEVVVEGAAELFGTEFGGGK